MRHIMKEDFTAKIAILYMIDKCGETAEEDILTQTATDICGISYFVFRQYIFDLGQTKYIRHYASDGMEFYILTEKGKQALELFAGKLVYSLRMRITEYLRSDTPHKQNKNKFQCHIVPVNDLEYNVQFSFSEEELPVFTLEMRAGEKEQAKELMRVMTNNRERIYTHLYQYLMRLSKEEEQGGKEEDDIRFFE